MEFLILKTLLLLSNFLILSYLIMLVIRQYKSGYDKKSWAFLFHILTFLWLVFRGFFWLSTLTSMMKWSSAIFFVLYWMPTPLEFGAFMLLPLYFAQILYPVEWKKYWAYARPVYFGLTIGIFLFQSLWSLLQSRPKEKHCENVGDDYFEEECFHTEYSTIAFREITAVCFLFLAFIQCWFGVKVLKMDPNRYEQFLTTSPEMLSMVNILLVISFASRSFYQIMAIHQLMILPDVPLQPNDGDVQITIFMACELWIYIPTILVLLTFTSRTMGNAQQSNGKGNEYRVYFPGASNYGTNDEADYESLLREVPSRQGSFWTGKLSERIPIKVANLSEGGEVVYTASYPRTQSWLSEPSRPASLDTKSESQGKEGISLLTHYKKFRQRGFSAGSDASSADGGNNTNPPNSLGKPSNNSIPAGKKSVGKPGGGSSSSNNNRRKIRYYNEKKSSAYQSSGTSLLGKGVAEHEEDEEHLLKLSGEEEQEENEEDDEMITDTSHSHNVAFSLPSEMAMAMGKQYELMVEPPSPSPHTASASLSSSFIQESDYFLSSSQRKDSFRGIDSIRISSYEATGGDHIHGPNHVNPTNNPLSPLIVTHQRENSYYLEENSPALLNYHHNRSEGGRDNRDSRERKLDSSALGVNPIYPRPTRHNPGNHLFNPAILRVTSEGMTLTEQASSFSPSLLERTRSVDNNSTPDRDEAAKEASNLRRGMTERGRFSPN